MFPTSRIPRPLLRALDVAVEFATLGEVRLDPGWEEPAWLEDEQLRREWFEDDASSGTRSPSPRARAAFTPATPAGRLALEAAASAQRASRPPVCSGARGTRAVSGAVPLRRRQRSGAPRPAPQPCVWEE